MKGDGVLKKAGKLYLKRKYALVIRLLEPEIFSFRESFEFYWLLGMSCIYTGDWGGGIRFIKRADQITPFNSDMMLVIAVGELRRGKTAEAIRQLLFLLDKHPGCRKGKTALDMIRKESGKEDFTAFLRSRQIYRFLPRRRIYIKPRYWIIPGLLLVGTAVVYLASIGVFHFIFQKQTPIGYRSVPEGISDISSSLLAHSGDFIYDLTADEVEDTFESIRLYLQNYDDNSAQREINRLVLSNASTEVKARALNMASYIESPEFTSLKTNFSFAEVKAQAALYEGCYVIWKGKMTNIVVTEEQIDFDFLVGYHEERLLEGIVPARMFFAESLSEDVGWEILGRLMESEGALLLEVISLHPLF